MALEHRESDFKWGIALVAFVFVQLTYLYFDVVLLSPPAYDAPINEFRSLILDHASLIRWHALIPLVNFFGLLVPASVALRRRLLKSSSGDSVWPDLVVASSVVLSATMTFGLLIFAVFGLVPVAELSDSVIRATLMTNAFAVWAAGSIASAFFIGATSLAMLQTQQPPRKLAWFGLITAGLGLIGALWLINGDSNGPLLGLSIVARALFLTWVGATGVWLYRTARVTSSHVREAIGEPTTAATS